MKNVIIKYDKHGRLEDITNNFLLFEQENNSLSVNAYISTNKKVRAYIKSENNNSLVTDEILPVEEVYSLTIGDEYMVGGTLYVGYELYDDTGYIERLEPVKLYVDSFVSLGTTKKNNVYVVSMKIGDVVTLEPDEQATVENVGTKKDMILKFGIPRGEQGLRGYKGDPGYTPKKGVDYFTPEEIASFGIDKINGQMAIVQNDIENIYEGTPNLFNKNDERIVKGYFLSNKPVAKDKYSYTHPLPVIEGVRYKFTTDYNVGSNNKRIVYCNERGEYELREIDGGFADTQYADEMAEDYSYVAFTANKTGLVLVNIGTMSYDEFMFCELDKFPSEYVEFAMYSKLLTPMENLIGEPSDDLVRKLTNALGTSPLNGEIENIYESTPNLFNKNDERIVKGYSLSSDLVAKDRCSYTHPLPVIEGVRYKFTTTNAIGNHNRRIVYCNERGEYELNETYGTFTDTQIADEMAEDYSYVAFTAKKTGLVLVNIGIMSYDEFMFCELDKFPNEYVEFARYSKLLTPMENLVGEPSDDLVRKLANTLGTSPLSGKKASFNGDSICAGAGYSGGYGKIITDLFGMTYQNIGVGGGTIVTGQTTEAGKARHSVCGTIVNMDSDADYVIVEGGVNDASLGVPLGAISQGYNATFDTTTFYGAFESMCKELVTRFAGKKVGYIAVHKMTPQFSSTDTTYGYYQAAKKCCEKWGVPFCDLNTEVPPLKYMTSLKEAYTHNGDGWHPNKAGYDAYYVPKIIAFMERL